MFVLFLSHNSLRGQGDLFLQKALNSTEIMLLFNGALLRGEAASNEKTSMACTGGSDGGRSNQLLLILTNGEKPALTVY